MEDKVRESSDEVIIMTDDGSYGEKGVVTVGIEKFIQQEPHVDRVFAIGPPIMMKFSCLLTQKYNIPTDVSLNTIMVDGTGMCGACRLTIGGKTKFVCIDGPEFDGHQVDWDEMFKRMGTFKRAEVEEMEHYEDHICPPCEAEAKAAEAPKSSVGSDAAATTPADELTNRDAEWRKELRATMKPKDRTLIPRVIMPELDPVYRATTRTEEVNIGLTAEMALTEAKRCLDCPKPTCVEGCPVNINIPSFIKNSESGQISLPDLAPANGIKVAVVGSGPAGLSFAGDMAKLGYEVHVFEALHEIGGVLKYGIPEFRLPNKIVDVEIDNLKKMGVNFQTDVIVGKTISAQELEDEGFKGIFVASGAGLPNFMNIPGENYLNIMSSNEYLTRVNLMDAANPKTDTPLNEAHKVLVVGGGNTAMDSCRTAKRLGAEVTIVYRRSEAEMPARLEEVKHAKEEGINFMTLHNPIEYLADEKGAVRAAVLQVMELGEPDASGRRSPVPVEGKTVTIDVDQVIVAVGVSPNPLVPKSIEGLELGRKNTIVVNDDMQSSRPNLFAGGDIVRGGATVILAMGDGRRAALNMHKRLSNM